MATVFISYACVDEQFALGLARDLRSAGVAVWLDKLDVLPSQRWDRAIEEAMERCPRFLIILSPNSVTSNNVLDEINFALEKGKVVIPVLYQTCNVPYRLRLYQHADFTGDYRQGMERLQRVLRDDEPTVRDTAAGAASAPILSGEPPRSPAPLLETVAVQASSERKVERTESSSASRSEQEREDVLRTLLDRPEWRRKIHLKPNIPSTKLRNACRSLSVGDSEKVVCLIDATSWGSAKEAILVGVQGVRFLSNGVPFFLSYADLRAAGSMSVTEHWFYHSVCMRSSGRFLAIDTCGPLEAKELMTVLSELKKVDW
jgi:hypothetical protein